jgi:peptidoglycan hydrolase CwlO-like protein
MRKTVIILAAAATVGLGTVLGGASIPTEAASISSLKDQQNKVQKERSGVKSDLEKQNEKISNLQNQQNDVLSEINRLETAINQAAGQIKEKTAKISETKAEITKLQEESVVLKERIEKRNVLLKDRIRSYQETGGMISYLDVLFGATSFSDFIDRANAVATIMAADQDIMEQHKADKSELETKQNEVQKNLGNLEIMVAELEKTNQQLNEQKAEKDNLMASLEEQESEVLEVALDLKEQEKILAAQEAAIKRSLAAAQAPKTSASSSSSSGSGGSDAPAVSSGNFTRPAPGVITSTYGMRKGKMHYGVDIAKAGGGVPIWAAADGEVYSAHVSESYGNVVYILHNINGQIYTTVYAHMSSIGVSNGATVKKGQQIGTMGNTGASRGQHLHFELYKGRWAYHSAIDPAGIVPY